MKTLRTPWPEAAALGAKVGAVKKNPILIIANLDNQDLYSALPLWDEQVEIFTFCAASRHSQRFCADLVLVDCDSDDIAGLEMLREIKQKNPDVPVMFITSAGSEESAVEAFRIGAHDYFKKPLDLLQFRNTVRFFIEVKRTNSWERWQKYRADQTRSAAHAPECDLPPNLLRCIRYIKENLGDPISLESMAQEGGLSKHHFCREFKKIIGMTPMQFLSRLRIKRSKDLLRKDIPVSTVAMKVGFNDLSSFNRHFRELVGGTPSEFKKSLQRES
ncbi:response regulator transcription factor [Geomonas subterranea]|uniref:helix-turn-helix domain-containing protein n=1 Tax=Geomonas subterranea TaxID=2847989 RepID=UPI001C4695E0|nr:helix-turn-helix domain-containing protein [Geomonas subterranea]QXM09491.1 response regulator transcription factor [Geomonas subterranea]